MAGEHLTRRVLLVSVLQPPASDDACCLLLLPLPRMAMETALHYLQEYGSLAHWLPQAFASNNVVA
jgi:hypothetical protein